MMAAEKGRLEVVRDLLERKADPTHRDAGENTALHFAAQVGQLKSWFRDSRMDCTWSVCHFGADSLCKATQQVHGSSLSLCTLPLPSRRSGTFCLVSHCSMVTLMFSMC